MFSIFPGMNAIRREEVVTEYLNNIRTTTLETVINQTVTNHQKTYGHTKIIPESKRKTLIKQFNERWRKSSRCRNGFVSKNKKWLTSEIELHDKDNERNDADPPLVNVCDDEGLKNSGMDMGRPSTPFSESSESTKRRKTKHLREKHSTEELAYATQMKMRQEGMYASAKLCVQSTSSDTAADILRKVSETKETMFSPLEALNVIVSADLSKDGYSFIRQAHREKGCFMYPPYEQVLTEKKHCYPEGISVTEFEVHAPLQNVLDHTVKRLLKDHDSAIDLCFENGSVLGEEERVSLELITKYGIDGSGDQALYSMKYDQSEHSEVCETSIVSSFVCPVRLCLTGSNKVVWQNKAPSSPYFCRPIKLAFRKESSDHTREEISHLQEEIQNLIPTLTEKTKVHHKMLLTMVDGKVCQALTHTPSAASCYICKPKTNPSGMNNLNEIEGKGVEESALSYGLSPLHLLINSMECILHVAYRMKIKTWMVKGSDNKNIYNDEKTRIYRELKKHLGLNVDRPAQGSGNTNNGNTARRFFDNAETVAKVTGIDVRLIQRFSVILRTLNSGFEIDSNKYDIYAKETANLFVQLYEWYYMPMSVHKMLMHGKQIIDSLCISVGHASEEGLEATHKLLRSARNYHTCKQSRIRSNTDLIHWLYLISDPLLAGLRKKSTHKNDQLPTEVLSLLLSPQA